MKHRGRIAGAVLAVAAVALFTTGCATLSGSAGPKPSATGDYLACLRRNGVNLPSGGPSGVRRTGQVSPRPSGSRPSGVRPSGSPRQNGGFGFGSQAPPGVDQSTWDKAQAACGALRPSRSPQGNRDNGAITAYRNCLADHGVDPSAGIDRLDSGDPTVAAAMQACAVLRPSGRPAPTPTSTG